MVTPISLRSPGSFCYLVVTTHFEGDRLTGSQMAFSTGSSALV